MLDLRRLRLLRELEARGTIGAVARALDYTPSAVSQQLSVLEREAGVPLLQRAGRNVTLTDAAHVLVEHAATLLAGVEAAESDLAAVARGRVAGTVRIGAFQTAVLHIVAPAVQALADTHPDVRVEVAETELEAGLPALELQALDVVIGDEYGEIARPRPAAVEREDLLRERLRLVLPAAHPLARAGGDVRVADLSDASWATGPPGTGQREMVVRLCRSRGGFEPDLRHRSNDLGILLALVGRADAVSLLPDLVRMADDDAVAVRDAAGARLHRIVFALTRAGSAERPALAVVRDALRAAARAIVVT